MKVVFARRANKDIVEIGEHIARDNPDRAARFVQELIDKANGLATMPHAFPLVPRYERRGIRRRGHGRYLIFYVPEAKGIRIVRILHGSREYGGLLDPSA